MLSLFLVFCFLPAFLCFGPPVDSGLLCDEYEPLASESDVDLSRYAGTWYEIATSEQVYSTFQFGCVCTQVRYTITPEGYVNVENMCRFMNPQGSLTYINGRADVLDPSFPGQLGVTFFSPIPVSEANYYIIKLGDDDNYGSVLVGEPCRKSLWILSRNRTIDDETFDAYVEIAEQNGFDTEDIKFMRTQQTDCPAIYPRSEIFLFEEDEYQTLTSLDSLLSLADVGDVVNNWIIEMVEDQNENGLVDDGDKIKLNQAGKYVTCSVHLCTLQALSASDPSINIFTVQSEGLDSQENPIAYLESNIRNGRVKYLALAFNKMVLTPIKKATIFKIISPDRPVAVPNFPFKKSVN